MKSIVIAKIQIVSIIYWISKIICMNIDGKWWVLAICLIFLIVPSTSVLQTNNSENDTPGSSGNNSLTTASDSDICNGPESISYAAIIARMDAMENSSPRVLVVNSNVLRGKPLYVARPPSDQLARPVRIWKFDDTGITVSTQSASDLFSHIPVQDESGSMLLDSGQTSAVSGLNQAVVLEYPSVQDRFDIAYDRESGSVSDSLTGKKLFSVPETSPPRVCHDLITFLDATGHNRGGDSFVMYSVSITEPYIRINPFTSIVKGSVLKISGTTNLPPGDAVEGRVRVSNLYNHPRDLLLRGFVVSGSQGQNSWTLSTNTSSIPLSEYFFSIEPVDRNINTYAISKLFSILPANGTPVSELDYQTTSRLGSTLLPCNSREVLCGRNLDLEIFLVGQYNRIVLTKDPVSLNITNATFERACGATPWTPPKTVEMISATIHNVNNKTLIIDPDENLCFTDFRNSGLLNYGNSCNGCTYRLNISITYPNPAVNSPGKNMLFMIGTGNLWMDNQSSAQTTIAPNVTGKDPDGRKASSPQASAITIMNQTSSEIRRPAPPISTQKASSPIFSVVAAVIIPGILFMLKRK